MQPIDLDTFTGNYSGGVTVEPDGPHHVIVVMPNGEALRLTRHQLAEAGGEFPGPGPRQAEAEIDGPDLIIEMDEEPVLDLADMPAAVGPTEPNPDTPQENTTYEGWQAVKDTAFVNPYTFVDLAPTVERTSPRPHSLCDRDQLSGEIVVKWTATTPLKCSVVRLGEGDDEYGTFATRGDGAPVIPGSSVKGALRSLHEALAGGCMRVLNLDYVPSYRLKAIDDDLPHRAHEDTGWHLALVESVDRSGCPDSLALSRQVVRVQGALLGVPEIQNGDSFDLTLTERSGNVRDKSKKQVVSATSTTTSPDRWTLLVNRSLNKDNSEYWCAAGQFHNESTTTVTCVEQSAWQAFQQARAVADGKPNRGESPAEHVEVEHDQLTSSKVAAQARNPHSPIRKGDVLWVQTNQDKTRVEAMSMAELWRTSEKGLISARMGRSDSKPCSNSSELCPSCRLFGSSDSEGDQAGSSGAVQESFRGRVRCSDAVLSLASRDDLPVPTRLAPLASPKPAYGRFYLKKAPRRWPMPALGDEKGQLRGRKFYWHGDPNGSQIERLPGQARRHKKRREAGDMPPLVQLAPADTTLESTVRFVGLTRLELGSLLATIDPARVLANHRPNNAFDPNDTRMLTRLGGGKPLGLGSVAPEIISLTVATATERYLTNPSPTASTDPEDFIEEFVGSVPDGLKRRCWPPLAAVLSPGHVPAEAVWYPPATTWTTLRQQGNFSNFDDSYTFFIENEKPNRDKSKQRLPEPTVGPQHLAILTKTGEKRDDE